MISYISLQVKQPLEGEVIVSHENVFYDFVFKQAYKKFVCFRDPISQLNSSREKTNISPVLLNIKNNSPL